MKGIIFSIVVILFSFLSSICIGADVDLKWAASIGATGYKIQKSLDQGITWSVAIDVGNVTTYKFLNVEENGLVLFRVSAYNGLSEAVRSWSGAWFDQRKKPVSSPAEAGIY